MTITDVAISVQALVSVIVLFISISNNYQIKVVHKATNSMKDELVNEVRIASIAKGRLEQKVDQLAERNGKVDQTYHQEAQ